MSEVSESNCLLTEQRASSPVNKKNGIFFLLLSVNEILLNCAGMLGPYIVGNHWFKVAWRCPKTRVPIEYECGHLMFDISILILNTNLSRLQTIDDELI